MRFYDELLVGAIDLHCHVDLEFSADQPKREPEAQWLAKAETMGLRGVVLKSHWWPTVSAVPLILASTPTKVSVWSSIALNSCVGGPHACVVEACAALGGKVIFLPMLTASSAAPSQIALPLRVGECVNRSGNLKVYRDIYIFRWLIWSWSAHSKRLPIRPASAFWRLSRNKS